MSENVVPDRHTKLLASGANLAVEATAAQAVGALRSAGIRSILLKGPSLARWLYDSTSTRIAIDVDLLIAVPHRSAAETVLMGLGYNPFPSNVAGEETKHAHHWDRDLNTISVDLHLTLPGVGVSNEDAWSVLSRNTEEFLVGGLPMEILTAPARAMHVALHAAQHGRAFEGPLTDLERALDLLSPEVWDEAAGLALRLGAESMFAAGLGLLEPGRLILARLDLPELKTVEVALRAESPPDLALGLHRLTTIQGLLPKAVFIARKVVPPPAWMRVWLPLARRGKLGLAIAYAWRPLWFILRAPSALRAWQRARKESQASA